VIDHLAFVCETASRFPQAIVVLVVRATLGAGALEVCHEFNKLTMRSSSLWFKWDVLVDGEFRTHFALPELKLRAGGEGCPLPLWSIGIIKLAGNSQEILGA
jgi:hypothetical protein